MKRLLKQVKKWRRNCGLAGGATKYDYFHSCYGNPDGDVVFIAEIPSLIGLDNAISGVPKEKLWATPWYGRGKPPQILRESLMTVDLIPSFCEHEPWKWKCWLTNFVKCPEYDRKWHKKINHKKKTMILRQSAKFLEEELKIINPSVVVFIGNSAEAYFKRTGLERKFASDNSSLQFYKLLHYSDRKSVDEKRKHYERELKLVMKKLNRSN